MKESVLRGMSSFDDIKHGSDGDNNNVSVGRAAFELSDPRRRGRTKRPRITHLGDEHALAAALASARFRAEYYRLANCARFYIITHFVLSFSTHILCLKHAKINFFAIYVAK
ncbi:MAG: hypothetical protein WCT29_00360 [Candidatus Paceibacterota bacterium]